MKIQWWPWGILTAISLALLLFFVLYPLGVLFGNSVTGQDGGFSLEGFRALLADSQYVEAFGNTLILGLAVTTCTVLVGVPFAYMVARYDFPLKNLVAILPVLTIVIPEIIVGQSWLLILGNNGILTNLLGDAGISLPSFYGWTGMVFSMTLVYYTYIYLGVLAALRGFDGQLEEAGLSLGTPPFLTKLRVLVPVLLPAVLVNALVVFTLVVGNFALAMLLGSRVPLLSVMTYNTFVSEMGGSPTLQSAMSVVSIAIVAIVLFFQKRVVERKVYTMTQGRAPAAVRVRSWTAALYTGGVGMVIFISMLPLIVVFIAAFTKTSGPVMQWGQWSLASMQGALHGAPEPILNSLKFASLATVLGVAFAVLASYLTIKKRSASTQVLDYIVVLPLTISGTVLGHRPGADLQYRLARAGGHLRDHGAVLHGAPPALRGAQRLVGAVQHPRVDRGSLDQPGRVPAHDLLQGGPARHEGIDHLGRHPHVADDDLRAVGLHRRLQRRPGDDAHRHLPPGRRRQAGHGFGLRRGAGHGDRAAHHRVRQSVPHQAVLRQITHSHRGQPCNSSTSFSTASWPRPWPPAPPMPRTSCSTRPTTPRRSKPRWTR